MAGGLIQEHRGEDQGEAKCQERMRVKVIYWLLSIQDHMFGESHISWVAGSLHDEPFLLSNIA